MINRELILLHAQELRNPGSHSPASRNVCDTRTVPGCLTSDAQVSQENHSDDTSVSPFNVSSLVANIKRFINHPSTIDSIVIANLSEAIHIDFLRVL